MNQPTDLRFCIQCVDRTTGAQGDFVYHRLAPFRAVSPVFKSCDLLFQWMKQQGYSTGVLADFIVYAQEEVTR